MLYIEINININKHLDITKIRTHAFMEYGFPDQLQYHYAIKSSWKVSDFNNQYAAHAKYDNA